MAHSLGLFVLNYSAPQGAEEGDLWIASRLDAEGRSAIYWREERGFTNVNVPGYLVVLVYDAEHWARMAQKSMDLFSSFEDRQFLNSAEKDQKAWALADKAVAYVSQYGTGYRFWWWRRRRWCKIIPPSAAGEEACDESRTTGGAG